MLYNMEPQRESTCKRKSPKIKASQSEKIRKFFDIRKYRKGYRTYKSKENILSSDLAISKKKEVVGLCNNGFDNEDLHNTRCDLPRACGSSNTLNTDITDPICCDPILVISVANSEESLPRDVTQTSDTRCKECNQYHESLNAKIRELYTERDRLIREMDAMNNSHSYRVEQKEREIHGLVEMLQKLEVGNTTLREVKEREIRGLEEMLQKLEVENTTLREVKEREIRGLEEMLQKLEVENTTLREVKEREIRGLEVMLQKLEVENTTLREVKEREIRGLKEMLQKLEVENTTLREVKEREIRGLEEMLQKLEVENTTIHEIYTSLIKKALLIEEENTILRVELNAEQKKNVENARIHKNMLTLKLPCR